MAVFRIERTRDYTVMSNHHRRNHELSLKAKGLLSMMLSLPDDWNYTTRGLAKICKEGVDAIGGALRELETAGYIVRHQLRDRQGRISDTEYVIYEQPQPRQPETPQPDTAVPDTASPDTENPYLDKPDTEKPAELNIEKSNTQKSITHGSSTDSIPFREPAAVRLPERKGRDAMSLTEMESYRDLILENIEYDHLCREFTTYREDLDEIVELMVETVCAKRKTTRIAGSDFPHEVVRSRFLKLDCSHIEFVMECLRNNTTEIRNMKQYLLAVLFNLSFCNGKPDYRPQPDNSFNDKRGRRSPRGSAGFDRRTGRTPFRRYPRLAALCICYDRLVCGPATGRNSCTAMGFCISGYGYPIPDCKAGMAHRA